jgi:uncharacterized protein involved in exopolysaccharide biosynthesis
MTKSAQPSSEDEFVEQSPSSRRFMSRDWDIAAGILGVFLLLGVLVGFLTTLAMETQYAAVTDFEYPISQEQPTGFLREDRNLTTQVVLLGNRAVLLPVAAKNGLSVEDLAEKSSAEVVDGSEIVRLEVRDPDRAVAVKLASEISAQYIDVTSAFAQESRQYVLAQLDKVQRDLAAAETAAERESLIERRAALRDRLDSLRLASAPARILTPAYSPDEPVSPNRLLAAAAGGLAALLVGLVAVALLMRRKARARLRAEEGDRAMKSATR